MSVMQTMLLLFIFTKLLTCCLAHLLIYLAFLKQHSWLEFPAVCRKFSEHRVFSDSCLNQKIYCFYQAWDSVCFGISSNGCLFFFLCLTPSLPVIAIYSICFALYLFVNVVSVSVTYSGSKPFMCAIIVFVVFCGSYAPLSFPVKS